MWPWHPCTPTQANTAHQCRWKLHPKVSIVDESKAYRLVENVMEVNTIGKFLEVMEIYMKTFILCSSYHVLNDAGETETAGELQLAINYCAHWIKWVADQRNDKNQGVRRYTDEAILRRMKELDYKHREKWTVHIRGGKPSNKPWF